MVPPPLLSLLLFSKLNPSILNLSTEILSSSLVSDRNRMSMLASLISTFRSSNLFSASILFMFQETMLSESLLIWARLPSEKSRVLGSNTSSLSKSASPTKTI